MNCHQHNSKAATAVCRACGRAVCAECMQISDYREAVCSDVCNQERERAHAIRAAITVEIDTKERAYRGGAYLLNLLLVAPVCLTLFIAYEVYVSGAGRLQTAVGTFMAGVLILLAAVCIFGARVLRRSADDYRAIADRLEQ